MNKPTIPNEVADVIEKLRQIDDLDNSEIIARWYAQIGDGEPLQKIPFDTLLCALINGYTREPTESQQERKKIRDLKRDLEICEAASDGLEVCEGDTKIFSLYIDPDKPEQGTIINCTYEDDAIFIVEAREGWPEAIRRAIAAEAEIERLKGESEHWKREALQKYPTPDAYNAACAALPKHRERADAAEAEVKHLRQVLELIGKGWKFKKEE